MKAPWIAAGLAAMAGCLHQPAQYEPPPPEPVDAAAESAPPPTPPVLPPVSFPPALPRPDARPTAAPDAPVEAPPPADTAPPPADSAPDASPDAAVPPPLPPQPPPQPPPCPVRCSDGTCAQTSWNFERVDLAGITATVPPASRLSPLEVALGASGRALAARVDLATGNGVTLTVPVCDSGTLDARRKTLRGSVRIDGPPAEFSLVVLYPGPVFSFQNPFIPAPAMLNFESNVDGAQTNDRLKGVTKFLIAVDARVAWRGTIWFDDLEIADR